jgi:hypothetical protein
LLTDCVAVAFLYGVAVCAEFVVGVAAHEMHGGKFKLLITLTAVFLIKIFSCALHS